MSAPEINASAPWLYQPKKADRKARWREYLNPLIAINISIIIARLQSMQLGIVSDLMWLYRFIERRDATLSALVERRCSSILELDWNIKTVPVKKLQPGCTEAMAEAQAQALRTAYERVDNLSDAYEWLELASFRGFAHLEKHYDDDGNVIHLEPVPQWNWARDGLYGRWCYNPRAISVRAGDGDTVEIDEDDFVIREVSCPVDEIAILCWIRKSMSQKDWDSFIEIYGLPPLFIEMPADVPVEQQAAYYTMAQAIMTDSRGVLPNGAKIQSVDNGSRGKPPFLDHVRYQDEQMVLKGTGGLLTMLAQSGSGTLAGGAHNDSFRTIAQASAKRISTCMQHQFDRPLLNKQFPNQPILAYFELAAREETDPTQVIEDVNNLAKAGISVSLDEVSEKSGYTDLSTRPATDKSVDRAQQGNAQIGADQTGDDGDPSTVQNRQRDAGPSKKAFLNAAKGDAQEALLAKAKAELAAAQAKALAPLREKITAAMSGPDDDLPNRIKAISAELPEMLSKMNVDPDSAKILMNTFASALIGGLTTPETPTAPPLPTLPIKP